MAQKNSKAQARPALWREATIFVWALAELWLLVALSRLVVSFVVRTLIAEVMAGHSGGRRDQPRASKSVLDCGCGGEYFCAEEIGGSHGAQAVDFALLA